MKQAPETTQSPKNPAPKPANDSVKSPSTVFMTMALDMTWRLAIVVLVPVIGGSKLDEAIDTTPVFTLLGFLIAMAGMAFVLWQIVQKANKVTFTKKDKESRDV